MPATHNTPDLEGIVFGEGDNLHDFADPGEDLVDDVEGDGVDHVLDDHAKYCIRPTSLQNKNCHWDNIETWHWVTDYNLLNIAHSDLNSKPGKNSYLIVRQMDVMIIDYINIKKNEDVKYHSHYCKNKSLSVSVTWQFMCI